MKKFNFQSNSIKELKENIYPLVAKLVHMSIIIFDTFRSSELDRGGDRYLLENIIKISSAWTTPDINKQSKIQRFFCFKKCQKFPYQSFCHREKCHTIAEGITHFYDCNNNKKCLDCLIDSLQIPNHRCI